MTTIKELIEQLQEIENKDQAVIFQYFIAEHLIDQRTDDNMEPDVFAKVAEKVAETEEYLWDQVYEDIGNVAADVTDELPL